jgi:hypothetical protein
MSPPSTARNSSHETGLPSRRPSFTEAGGPARGSCQEFGQYVLELGVLHAAGDAEAMQERADAVRGSHFQAPGEPADRNRRRALQRRGQQEFFGGRFLGRESIERDAKRRRLSTETLFPYLHPSAATFRCPRQSVNTFPNLAYSVLRVWNLFRAPVRRRRFTSEAQRLSSIGVYPP